MNFEGAIEAATRQPSDAYSWLGQVLTNFAVAEQALGELSLALGLSIANGGLGSLEAIRRKLRSTDNRKAKALDKRIERWCGNRPVRHLLAHATITLLTDVDGNPVVVTRHLPRDKEDVTPDRLWTEAERIEILRQASADGRSIKDHVHGLLADKTIVQKLRSAAD
jgi:hypothetical protein